MGQIPLVFRVLPRIAARTRVRVIEAGNGNADDPPVTKGCKYLLSIVCKPSASVILPGGRVDQCESLRFDLLVRLSE